MRAKNLLSTKQYGSINGRPTTKKLCPDIDNCIANTVAGGVVDTIYLNLAKTFDSTTHHRWVGKFKSCCINGSILV